MATLHDPVQISLSELHDNLGRGGSWVSCQERYGINTTTGITIYFPHPLQSHHHFSFSFHFIAMVYVHNPLAIHRTLFFPNLYPNPIGFLTTTLSHPSQWSMMCLPHPQPQPTSGIKNRMNLCHPRPSAVEYCMIQHHT